MILTVTRQPAGSMVALIDKVMFSPRGLSREMWLAEISRGVADTSWSRKQYFIILNIHFFYIQFTLIDGAVSYHILRTGFNLCDYVGADFSTRFRKEPGEKS